MLRDHFHWCNPQDRRTAPLDLPRQKQSMWKNSRSLQFDLNCDRAGNSQISHQFCLTLYTLPLYALCFGRGCDFVMSKISMLNEFYKLNRTFVFEKDGFSDRNRFAPVSMCFREPEWARVEMLDILKEVDETALRNCLH